MQIIYDRLFFRCKQNVIIVGVFCALLALATTVCNATVLAVFFTNKKPMNSQVVYKVSLAFADLLVGIFVFPTFISTLTQSLMGRHELGELYNISNAVNIEGNTSQVLYKEIRAPSGLLNNRIPQSYYDVVGFFTTLSLTVSIYTLAAASIDRFMAVFKPMKHQLLGPASVARKSSLTIWIIGVIFSSLPLYVEDLGYRRITLILISSGGHAALILYLLAFVLPLLVMWTMTIATMCSFRSQNKLSKKLSSTKRTRNNSGKASVEMRLAVTLGIMVGVFTLCVLPAGVVIAATLFTPNISLFNPLSLNQELTNAFLSAEVAVTIILTTNSLWNFFIYSGRDTKFRKATRNRYISLLHTLNPYRSGSKSESTFLT